MATFSISLRIMGVDLEPEAVSESLDLQPSMAHRKGDPHFGQSGRQYSDFSEGLWLFKSSLDKSSSPNDHLSYLADKLLGKEETLRHLRSIGYRVDIFVGVFGEETGTVGFSISHETLARLVSLGTKLEFDVYD